MINYDYHKLLEPMEFQKLSRDIIQIRDGIFLESYKEGKDQGVDGGYFHKNHSIILQAKRKKSDYRSLLRQLKNEEVEKVKKINPDRYILCVSMNLSKKEKEEIKQIFHPYITNSADILTEEDFNNLLGDEAYKSIENKYYKLWMASTNVLQNMLNSTYHSILLQESVNELEEGFRSAEVFVETEVYDKALRKLKEKRVVLISGEPGMGKTTIARQLGTFFIRSKGYEKFFWVKSVDDILVAQRIEGKKVILFDDFWGSIFQESSLAGRDEQRLAKIIERMKYEKDCILILTTREYVLKQGLQKHADLNEVVDKYKLECRLNAYSDIEKVKIFFGHLKQSKLSWQQTQKLFHENKKLVRHPNYNPRVIDMFLQNVELDIHPKECVERFWEYLESPQNFWRAIFNNLSTEANLLSIILLISPIPALCDDIKKTYYKCLEQMERTIERKGFQESFEELERTVIKSLILENKHIIIKFQNPSAQDYLFNYLHKNINQYFYILLNGSCYYGQLLYLLSHYSYVLSDEKHNALMKKCIENFRSMPIISEDYSEYLEDNEFEYFSDDSFTSTELSRFFSLMSCHETNKQPEYLCFFSEFIEQFNMNMKNAWIEIEEIDLDIYPMVIKHCVEHGICLNGTDIITTYFERICYKNRNLDIDDFKDIYPNEYSNFIINNRLLIQDYIEEYYVDELDYYTDTNDVFRCKYLYSEIPKQLSKYGLPYTEKFKATVETYMSYLDEELEDQVNDGNEEDYKSKSLELAYNETVNIAEREIFGEASYFYEEDLQDFIQNSALNESLKNELMEVQQSDVYWFIREFLEDERSFLFLERNLLEFGCLIKDAMFFITQLIAGIVSNSDIPQQKILGFLINVCDDIIFRENAVLTKEEIMSTEAYILYFEYEEHYFERLVESGLFVKHERWYELVNVLLVMMPYGLFIANMKKEDKIEYYNSMDMTKEWSKLRVKNKKESIVENKIYLADIGLYYFENNHWEKLFFKMFLELDPDDFLENYVRPIINQYYKSIKRETLLETAEKALKDLELEISINKNGEYVGSSMCVPLVWRLLESLDMAYIDDFIPEEFSEEQMNYIADKFEFAGEVYHIHFAKLESTEIISILEIDRSVVRVYEKIHKTLERMLLI
ncbi:ATP-binding protein [Paenibacillus thiaminolyticus]|uniref:ATP-binding protein n=1 Tax=Paenibacillus thiaminolyticus TaxID=49283 RepID=UPI002543DEE1|nr:ATP-binding protein [Paenibacillus thiaminolyticus]WII38406.1 ATP-binding protein [Paenibacillus thiaminolyticus]